MTLQHPPPFLEDIKGKFLTSYGSQWQQVGWVDSILLCGWPGGKDPPPPPEEGGVLGEGGEGGGCAVFCIATTLSYSTSCQSPICWCCCGCCCCCYQATAYAYNDAFSHVLQQRMHYFSTVLPPPQCTQLYVYHTVQAATS